MTAQATTRAQPEQPSRPTVVYDGECAYCRRQVQKMQQRDQEGVFDYVPRQTEGLTERFPKLAEGDFNTGMRLVHEDGSVSVGADAIYRIATRLAGWKRLAWLYRVPGLQQLFRAAYGWVAKNRHRLAKRCEDGACEI
jgi:predicted DCC family thiol-disulfide oxidoreductase YuxK